MRNSCMQRYQNMSSVCLQLPFQGMRFVKKGNSSSRYVSFFEVLDDVGPMVHRLELLQSLLGVYLIFHVSMIKRYHGDGDYIIKWYSILLDRIFLLRVTNFYSRSKCTKVEEEGDSISKILTESIIQLRKLLSKLRRACGTSNLTYLRIHILFLLLDLSYFLV